MFEVRPEKRKKTKKASHKECFYTGSTSFLEPIALGQVTVALLSRTVSFLIFDMFDWLCYAIYIKVSVLTPDVCEGRNNSCDFNC